MQPIDNPPKPIVKIVDQKAMEEQKKQEAIKELAKQGKEVFEATVEVAGKVIKKYYGGKNKDDDEKSDE